MDSLHMFSTASRLFSFDTPIVIITQCNLSIPIIVLGWPRAVIRDTLMAQFIDIIARWEMYDIHVI